MRETLSAESAAKLIMNEIRRGSLKAGYSIGYTSISHSLINHDITEGFKWLIDQGYIEERDGKTDLFLTAKGEANL